MADCCFVSFIVAGGWLSFFFEKVICAKEVKRKKQSNDDKFDVLATAGSDYDTLNAIFANYSLLCAGTRTF